MTDQDALPGWRFSVAPMMDWTKSYNYSNSYN